MIVSTQIANSEIFAFIAVLFLYVTESQSFVYKQKRQNRNWEKVGYFLRQ